MAETLSRLAHLVKHNSCIDFYVSVTVHREQSVKKEYQQDATV